MGHTDIEGQIAHCEVTAKLLEEQIEQAREEKKKKVQAVFYVGIVFWNRRCTFNMLKRRNRKYGYRSHFKIAAIGIIVAVLNQLLIRSDVRNRL